MTVRKSLPYIGFKPNDPEGNKIRFEKALEKYREQMKKLGEIYEKDGYTYGVDIDGNPYIYKDGVSQNVILPED